MKAVVTPAFGPPDVLELRDVPRPEVPSSHVLIQIGFSGVCRHDLLTRAGAFPAVKLPRIQGHQISGRVVELGLGVDQGLLGQLVTTMLHVGCGHCASCRSGDQSRCTEQMPLFLGDELDGSYAEYISVPAGIVVPIPDGLDLASAAMANCTFGTAWHAIVARGRFRSGDIVAVTGATGGVGLHTLKVLHHLGIESVAVTSRSSAEAMLRDAGADHVIVATESWAAVARRQGLQRLSGVIDCVGGSSIEQALRAIRAGGTIVQLGNVAGGKAEISPALLLLKETQIIGSKSATRSELECVLTLMREGSLALEISEEVPLSRVATAHEQLEAGLAGFGRIAIRIAEVGDGNI